MKARLLSCQWSTLASRGNGNRRWQEAHDAVYRVWRIRGIRLGVSRGCEVRYSTRGTDSAREGRTGSQGGSGYCNILRSLEEGITSNTLH